VKHRIFLLAILLCPLITFGSETELGKAVKNTTRATTPVAQTEKRAARWWNQRHMLGKNTAKFLVMAGNVIFLQNSSLK
jgi:hypothetical protein